MWRVLYFIVVVQGSLNNQKAAMRGFILHQSNPPCRDVDTNKLIPCTLTNQDDYQRLMSENTRYPAPQGQMKVGCKDGTINMTCLPLSLTPVRYFCACAAEKSDLNTAIGWNENCEEITESGFAIKRSLCDAEAGWCLDAVFRTNLVYLVKLYAPPWTARALCLLNIIQTTRSTMLD